MHYGQYAFSKSKKDHKVTIETKDKTFQNVIGHQQFLSFLDIKTLNLMYQCRPESCDKTDESCPEGGFVDASCRCMCETDGVFDSIKPCDDVTTDAEGKFR